jgi:enoyl-CoA hydratase/carnithine racemase
VNGVVREHDIDAGVLGITIDNPGKRNALSAEVLTELARCLDRVANDSTVRVAVLTGAGDVFCAGGDTARMGSDRPGPWEKREYLDWGVGRLARLFLRLDKPVIAAVNGAAIGAGMDLALWCDFRMAARAAYLLPGFIDLGLPPGFGGAWHLPHLVGPARAMEILLTGSRIVADEALALGLVRTVADTREELDAQVAEFAALLADKPSPAVRVTKRLVRRALATDALDHLEMAWASFGVLQETPEHVEAIRRLRERRSAATDT